MLNTCLSGWSMNLTGPIMIQYNKSLFNDHSLSLSPSEVGKQRVVGTVWTTTQKPAPWCRKGERGRGQDGNTVTTTVRKPPSDLWLELSSLSVEYLLLSLMCNVIMLPRCRWETERLLVAGHGTRGRRLWQLLILHEQRVGVHFLLWFRGWRCNQQVRHSACSWVHLPVRNGFWLQECYWNYRWWVLAAISTV